MYPPEKVLHPLLPDTVDFENEIVGPTASDPGTLSPATSSFQVVPSKGSAPVAAALDGADPVDAEPDPPESEPHAAISVTATRRAAGSE